MAPGKKNKNQTERSRSIAFRRDDFFTPDYYHLACFPVVILKGHIQHSIILKILFLPGIINLTRIFYLKISKFAEKDTFLLKA